jgi:ankyrin repeat protein
MLAGIGTTKSHRMALEYLTEAASLGYLNMRAIIYRLYQACGEVLPESIPIKKWLEDGVRSGSIIASEDLVHLLHNPIQWIRAHYNETNDSKGATRLFSVCRSDRLDDILAASDQRTQCDDSGPSCLHYVVGHDHPDLVSLIPALVASGSPVDSQSHYSFQQAFGLSHYGYLSKEGAPLHWAVARNSARAVTALIDLGADPYMCNTSGLSPAHVASFNHQLDLLEIILTHTKHVWKPDKFIDSLTVQALNQTIFQHIVCTGGDPDSLFRVLRLLRNTVKSECAHDAELLSLAIESRRTGVLKFLLDECKIDPNICAVHSGAESHWPLQIAVKSGHLTSFNLLVEHGLKVGVHGELTWAISSASVEDEIVSVIERLVELGVSVNTPDWKGNYPLHIAIDYGKINVVKCLLQLGADKELACTISPGTRPLTALGQLLYKPSLKATPLILKLLLNPEQGMGQPSSHSVCLTTAESSLHIICCAPSSVRDDTVCLSCFRILWMSYSDEKRMAYLNAFNVMGQAPLHCAIFSGNFLCVEELVQHCADVNLKDRHGKRQTPLDIACFLVSDRVLSHWQGQPSDMQVYQEQMKEIIRILKLKGATADDMGYNYSNLLQQ